LESPDPEQQFLNSLDQVPHFDPDPKFFFDPDPDPQILHTLDPDPHYQIFQSLDPDPNR
jgi:hypothetical protein